MQNPRELEELKQKSWIRDSLSCCSSDWEWNRNCGEDWRSEKGIITDKALVQLNSD